MRAELLCPDASHDSSNSPRLRRHSTRTSLASAGLLTVHGSHYSFLSLDPSKCLSNERIAVIGVRVLDDSSARISKY
jgi:hypothetical protein